MPFFRHRILRSEGRYNRLNEWRTVMEQTIFIICMFFGVTSVALIAFTLLGIVLGRIKV